MRLYHRVAQKPAYHVLLSHAYSSSFVFLFSDLGLINNQSDEKIGDRGRVSCWFGAGGNCNCCILVGRTV